MEKKPRLYWFTVAARKQNGSYWLFKVQAKKTAALYIKRILQEAGIRVYSVALTSELREVDVEELAIARRKVREDALAATPEEVFSALLYGGGALGPRWAVEYYTAEPFRGTDDAASWEVYYKVRDAARTALQVIRKRYAESLEAKDA